MFHSAERDSSKPNINHTDLSVWWLGKFDNIPSQGHTFNYCRFNRIGTVGSLRFYWISQIYDNASVTATGTWGHYRKFLLICNIVILRRTQSSDFDVLGQLHSFFSHWPWDFVCMYEPRFSKLHGDPANQCHTNTLHKTHFFHPPHQAGDVHWTVIKLCLQWTNALQW